MFNVNDSSSSSDEDIDHDLNNHHHRNRIIKPRINFELDDFKERFRLSRGMVEFLLQRIGNVLFTSNKNNALSETHQLLLALRFYASNSFYKVCGDAHGVSKATQCRVIQKITEAINVSLFEEYVQWPQRIVDVPQGFMQKGGMISVAGCIDGTHIRIRAPSENEPQYVNRHGYHSINTMLVCGPNLEFYYVSSRWPGSVNDARVLRNSTLHDRFENGWRPFPNAIILGDSGYPLKSWLITPFHNIGNLTAAQQRFNVAHKRTRSLVENSIALLKQRFSCLQTKLRVKTPLYAAEIIKTCAILHNIAIQLGENYVQNIAVMDDGGGNEINNDHVDNNGIARRNQLVQTFL